jgi:phosphohistidine swiveling domain-containing protein
MLAPTLRGRVEDPIHCPECSADTAWSTINAGEAIPGVVTPLTWSFFGDATDRAIKQTFCDMGVMPQSQVRAGAVPEERMWDVFHGRAAANLNMFRWVGDGMPGTSGDAIEEQIFGQVRPGVSSRSRYERYPVVAAKMPFAALRMTSALRRQVAPVPAFWQTAVAPGGLSDAVAARAALTEAHARFEAVMVPHTLAAMLCQALYEQLRRAAEKAGRPGLELRLITGYGQMAETDVVADLWQVSRDRLELDEFVRRHGYHGPDEGELSAPVWRLRREPLVALVQTYRGQGEEHDPRAIERVRAGERAEAERELLAALPRARRAAAGTVMRVAAKLIPLRGTGKAAFLQCVDVAREATRVLGASLLADGVLERPEDGFMLTVEELTAARPPAGIGTLAASRRGRHDHYRTLDIPDLFYGVAEAFPVGEAGTRAEVGEVITGTAVSPGVVSGPALVLLDPRSDEPLLPGEILVCRTTDPSWASAMMVAAALVIDIGGPISHGAIVARELGIPCAIGTRDAVKRVATGDVLEVDGGRGEVRILARAASVPETLAQPETDSSSENGSDKMTTITTEAQLPVLRALGLKGRAGADELGAATGMSTEAAGSALVTLVGAGLARNVRYAYMLTPDGREALTEMLAQERSAVDQQVVAAAYESFTAVNDQFKALASDWQMHGGEVNEHNDPSHDAEVLGRLPAIHARVTPIVDELAGQVPRLAVYGERLGYALGRVQDGDHTWLLRPLMDSYHTVWFELHEELISLAGRNRLEEAAAGRAH